MTLIQPVSVTGRWTVVDVKVCPVNCSCDGKDEVWLTSEDGVARDPFVVVLGNSRIVIAGSE